MTRQPGKHFKPKEPEPIDLDAIKEAPRDPTTSGADATDSARTGETPAGKRFSSSTAGRVASVDDGDSVAKATAGQGDRRKRILKRAGLVLAIFIVLLGVSAGGAYLYWQRSIEMGKEKLLESARKKMDSDVISYNGIDYKRNKDIVAVALLGYDTTAKRSQAGDAGQADFIMVAAVDTKDGSVRVVAIPRDSMVPVDRYVDGRYTGQEVEQICLAFSYGDGGATSSQYTVDAASRALLNVPINYYFSLDMEGIAALNDAVGGITLTSIEDIPSAGIAKGQEIHLMGEKATDYVRLRQKDVSASQARQRRQEQYLTLFMQKVLANTKGGDITSLVNLYNTATSYSVTNLDLTQFSYLATTIATHGVSGISIDALQGTMTAGPQYSEFHLDQDKVKQTVLNVFYTQVNDS